MARRPELSKGVKAGVSSLPQRPEGAVIAAFVAQTGRQAQTPCGVINDAPKKKLGLIVVSEMIDGTGR